MQTNTPKPPDPLPGPVGLFNVSVMPRFLLNSSRVGWHGAFFTSIVAAPAGRVDHGHQRYCLQRSSRPFEVRRSPKASWQTIPPSIGVWQPGYEQRDAWRRGGHAQFLFIASEHVARVLDGQPRRMSEMPYHPARSRVLELIFDALDADLAQGSPAGPLVGDGLITALIGHLAGSPDPGPAVLTASARRRVVEYIDANFARPMSLVDLAAVAGVGARQLCREFHASTGESPHQFVLRRRVDNAKALIAKGLPLADVAAACGFADQSQLTRTFARRVGVTPGRYRAALRG